MYYYLLYNSSFSFIVENRLFSTIFYGSILYILTHAVLNYCDVSLLTIINNYFWTTLSLDILSFTYAVYNSYINNTGVDCKNDNKTNTHTNNGSGDSNNMNVSFNLLKNKINTMFDRKNDLTITQIPQTKKNNNINTNKIQLQENFNNINNIENNNDNDIVNSNSNNDLDFSDLDNIDDIDFHSTSTQSPSTQYSTPITHLKGNQKKQQIQQIQQKAQQSIPMNVNMNVNNSRQGSSSTPISIIRNNVKIEPPMIKSDNDIHYDGSGESVAGSDVGSIMDLADFEKSF
jgi:hypothetical protein